MNIIKSENKRDIRALIQSDGVKSQLAMVLPKHMTADRMARVACTAVLKTPKLMDCKPESLLQALMLCSQAGLEPDGRNAHLIPYGDQVQVIFDYKGLVALAERNGVESIYADKVCENDEFDAWVEEGSKKLRHRVNWKAARGAAYAYYASCRRNGRLDYEVMTKDDVDAIRKRSRASGGGPWVTDYDEMAKKTVLRRMSKRWDISPEMSDALNSDADSPQQIGSAFVLPPPNLPDFSAKPEAPASSPALESPAPPTAPVKRKYTKRQNPPEPEPSPESAPEPELEPEPETHSALIPAAFAEAMEAAGVSADQILGYYNSEVRRPEQPEITELSMLPETIASALQKNLMANNEVAEAIRGTLL